MTQEQTPMPAEEVSAAGNAERLLALVAIGMAALTLIITLVLVFVMVDIRGDLAMQAKKLHKIAKELREQDEELRETLARLKAPPSVPARADKAAEAKPPAPVHMDSASPGSDCVIRPGSGKGLAECLGTGR